jgi:prepilin-type N-terminal cleavage/methylation domain-containing protein
MPLGLVNSQRGMTFIEVMTVLAVMTVISLWSLDLLYLQLANNNAAKFRADADNLTEEMRALLSSPDACKNSFGGFSAQSSASYSVSALKDGNSTPNDVYTVSTTYGDRSVNLASMTFDGFTPGSIPTKASMTLTSTLTPARQSNGPQALIRSINITMDIDASGNILSCVATAKMSDGLWQRSANNTQNIFFAGAPTGGNVGIGSATPTERLDLGGGNIKMGYSHVGGSTVNGDCHQLIGTSSCSAVCPPGKIAISGGAECFSGNVLVSRPGTGNWIGPFPGGGWEYGNTGWIATCSAGHVAVVVICANMK